VQHRTSSLARTASSLTTERTRPEAQRLAHLADLDAAAAASIGAIKVIRKDAVGALWGQVNQLLGAYAGEWSADTPEARLLAADRLAPRLPPTGWLGRTLSEPGVFVGAAELLSEWPP
jgi:hypothetical protein